MKGRVIVVVIMLLLITTGCAKLKNSIKKVENKIENVVESVPLMQFDKFKNIAIDKIKSISYIKYTEAGREEEEITDKEEIKKIYNKLSNIKVGKETNKACDDNTKVYVFNMNNDSKINVEIECDWLVIGNKRYEIK